MSKRILIVNGHPDPSPERFCAALAGAYGAGARGGGHEVERLNVGELDFPLIRSREAFETGALPADIARAQQLITWAEHIVIIHPLWLGAAPALVKGFFEQVFRYGFAMDKPGATGMPRRLLKGRSVRTVVTMGMPGAAYRAVFGGFGVRAAERGIFRLAGIGPITHDFVGLVDGPAKGREHWLAKMTALGRQGR